MTMQRVLVTGGAGFIGSHLCERLLGIGHEVVCMDNLFTGRRQNIAHLLGNSRFEFDRLDVNSPFVVEVDQIYHLACPASPIHYQRNPVRTIQTCVQGTMHALECARQVGARLFIASTSEVYGDPTVHPQHEGYWGNVNPIGPRACYDEGKRCGEALAVSYALQHDVDVRIARIFNTYGPRMHENDGRVVSNFVCQALVNEAITVNGAGSQTRSFCYVDDLVDAAIRFMDLDRDIANDNGLSPCPMNLGNPVEHSIRDVADLIIDLVGSTSTIEQRALPTDDPVRRRPEIARARKLLGWEPGIPLREGLARTIADFRARSSSAGQEGAR
jgi:UDP-glucuronate decarboxylase